MTQADRRYRPDIDGLRALAVGVVLIFHAFPARLPGGFVGVDVFFVISGYLISGIILDARAEGRFSFANFYARRIRRIFPALGAVLAAVLIAGWFLLYADDYARLGRHVAARRGVRVQLRVLAGSELFRRGRRPEAAAASVVARRRRTVLPGVAAAARRSRRAGGAARWRRPSRSATSRSCSRSGRSGSIARRRSMRRGIASGNCWRARRWPASKPTPCSMLGCSGCCRAPWLPDIAAATGLVAIAAGVWLIDATRVFPGLWVLLPVGGTFLLLVAGQRAWVNRAILSQPIVVFIGLISYPLYLWHWPLLSFAHIRRGRHSAGRRCDWRCLRSASVWRGSPIESIERPGAIRSARPRAPCRRWPSRCRSSAPPASSSTASGGLIDRPINRSDAARLVDYYERMRKTGLADAVSPRVRLHGLADASTPATRSIHRARRAGRAHTVLLWGDSFAQALSLGLRESLPAGYGAGAGHHLRLPGAEIDNFDLSVKERRCEKANLFAMDAHRVACVRTLVIIAQSGGHTRDRLAGADRARAGARRRAGRGRRPVSGVAAELAAGLRRASPAGSRRIRRHRSRRGSFDDDRTVAARVAGLAERDICVIARSTLSAFDTLGGQSRVPCARARRRCARSDGARLRPSDS